MVSSNYLVLSIWINSQNWIRGRKIGKHLSMSSCQQRKVNIICETYTDVTGYFIAYGIEKRRPQMKSTSQ